LPDHNLPVIIGLGDMFQAAETQAMSEQTLSELPSASQPRRLETFLLPYQLQGLAWLLKKEHPVLPTSPKEIVQMWSVSGRSKKLYQNVATMFTTEAPPFLASGGVLADDMGLGKTLQMISLIVTSPTDERKLVPAPLEMDGCTGGTLIVAPLSVMSNWANQITQHVSKWSPLKVYVYHGQGRSRPSLKDYDVVITSYGMFHPLFVVLFMF
jgi:SWI/SNF-related matrix-associated actin-dependent regulator of chromatin subfamily A3